MGHRHGPQPGHLARPMGRHGTQAPVPVPARHGPSAVFGPPAWPMARHGHGPFNPAGTGRHGEAGSPAHQRPAPAAYIASAGRRLGFPPPTFLAASPGRRIQALDPIGLELAARSGSTPVTSPRVLAAPFSPASLSPLS
jgi:hypothetical protein